MDVGLRFHGHGGLNPKPELLKPPPDFFQFLLPAGKLHLRNPALRLKGLFDVGLLAVFKLAQILQVLIQGTRQVILEPGSILKGMRFCAVHGIRDPLLCNLQQIRGVVSLIGEFVGAEDRVEFRVFKPADLKGTRGPGSTAGHQVPPLKDGHALAVGPEHGNQIGERVRGHGGKPDGGGFQALEGQADLVGHPLHERVDRPQELELRPGMLKGAAPRNGFHHGRWIRREDKAAPFRAHRDRQLVHDTFQHGLSLLILGGHNDALIFVRAGDVQLCADLSGPVLPDIIQGGLRVGVVGFKEGGEFAGLRLFSDN